MTKDWHQRAVCPCGWHVRAPWGDLFHVHADCCAHCGGIKPDRLGNGWTIRVMRERVVHEGVWWKPWTWRTRRYWETKSDVPSYPDTAFITRAN